jgi:hypothetical protein
MLVIGALALVLLLGPWAWRSWEERHLTDGKVKSYWVTSSRSSIDIAMCLMKRQPGGLTLDIASENHFTDASRGAVVEVTAQDHPRELSAWLLAGQQLLPGEQDQLDRCAAG